jgi:hypothetical protein
MILPETDLGEHLARARFFLEQAKSQSDPQKASWFLIASIYPARAIVELMVDYLKTGQLKGDHEDFRAAAAEKVRYFKVVEYLRDHDFHRRAVRFIPGQAMYGPIKLGTGKSPRASAAVTASGVEGRMEKQTTKTGSVKQDRPLQIRGFEINVEGEGWVQIDRILDTYLHEVESFIESYAPVAPESSGASRIV